MKPLEQLINAEKAALLHHLFPAEMPSLLKYMMGMSMTVLEEQETIKAKWENILSFEVWLDLAQEVKNKVENHWVQLETDTMLFADQLFDGYTALFSVHCLTQYTQQQNHPNEKFALAVSLFFA